MFLYHSLPYPHSCTENKTEVWAKVADEENGRSLFVNNDAMVKISIKAKTELTIADKWSINDEYYGRMVREGWFIPLDDLNKADDICEQVGWPKYEIDFGF
jgi:hypothetical protein